MLIMLLLFFSSIAIGLARMPAIGSASALIYEMMIVGVLGLMLAGAAAALTHALYGLRTQRRI